MKGEPGTQTAVDLMACTNDFLREVAFRAQQSRFAGLTVPIATPEDMILFKLSAWRTTDIPDAQAIRLRHRDRLDLPYLRKWAAWMVGRSPRFRDVPGAWKPFSPEILSRRRTRTRDSQLLLLDSFPAPGPPLPVRFRFPAP